MADYLENENLLDTFWRHQRIALVKEGSPTVPRPRQSRKKGAKSSKYSFILFKKKVENFQDWLIKEPTLFIKIFN